MTQLHLALLQHLLRFSARGQRATISNLSRSLRVSSVRVAAGLGALERAGLCAGTRLTLPGLAVAVATRGARPRRASALPLAA